VQEQSIPEQVSTQDTFGRRLVLWGFRSLFAFRFPVASPRLALPCFRSRLECKSSTPCSDQGWRHGKSSNPVVNITCPLRACHQLWVLACWLPSFLACLPACLLACLLACLPGCLVLRLRVGLLAALVLRAFPLACLLRLRAGLLASLLACCPSCLPACSTRLAV